MSTKPKSLVYCSLFAFSAFFLLGTVMRGIDTYPLWDGVPRPHDARCNVSGFSVDDLPEEEILGDGKVLFCPNEKKGMVREVSAYNSVPEQTDSTPCTSADGTDICQRHRMGECIVAANAYPLKTKLRIDTVGDCTVADRTHARYADRVDLFMDKDIQGAIGFGVQKLVIIEIDEDM